MITGILARTKRIPAMKKNTVIDKLYNYFLFDADGTLMDTTELIYQSYRKTVGNLTGKDVSRKSVSPLIGVTLETGLNTLLGTQPEKEMGSIIDLYTEYQLAMADQYICLFPGVKETLEGLKKQGKRLAVVSSRKSMSLISYLKTLGIYPFFDSVIAAESTKHQKPDPEPALAAMKQLRAFAAETLLTGDSRWDIECACRAGIDSCFVSWSGHDINNLPVLPTYYIDGMKVLMQSSQRAGDRKQEDQSYR